MSAYTAVKQPAMDVDTLVLFEIEPDHVLIRTFDHAQRAIVPRYDYVLDEGPDGLMSSWQASTRASFLSGRLKGIHVGKDGLSLKPLPTSHYLAYLDKPASSGVHAICPTERKIYVATERGYVWEYDRKSGLPLGAIYMDKFPTCVLATDAPCMDWRRRSVSAQSIHRSTRSVFAK